MLKPFYFIIDLCLLTLMAYLGVSFFYTAATRDFFVATSYKIPPKPAKDHSEILVPPLDHYQAIIKRNLFKSALGNTLQSQQINIDSLDQTGLDLILWGTVISDNGIAYAVIEQKDQNIQNLYQKGDTIAGATIKMILREKVVLRVGSNDEILEMEKRSSPQKRIQRASAYYPIDNNRFEADTAPRQEIVISRNQIHETVNNVHELMTQAQINPLFKTGRAGTAGLAISAINPDSIFRKMGLRDQDIILGIDGRIIQSMDDALDLYQHLKYSDHLNLQVERRGQTVELHYAIE